MSDIRLRTVDPDPVMNDIAHACHRSEDCYPPQAIIMPDGGRPGFWDPVKASRMSFVY